MCIMRTVVVSSAFGFRFHNFYYTKTGGNSHLVSVLFYPNSDDPIHMLIELSYGKAYQLNLVLK